MNSSCPGCGQPISDAKSDFCPKCAKLDLSRNGLSADEIQRVTELTCQRLRSDWKFNARVIAIVLASLIGVISIIDVLIGFNLKEAMTSHLKTQEIQATNRIADHLSSLDRNVSNTLAQVDVQMRSNVVRRFEAPAVQAIINDVAKAQAKGMLEEEVRPAVESFRNDALFIRTIARAQAYDFKAYQELLVLAQQSNRNSDLAKQVLSELERSLEKDRSSDILSRRVYMEFAGKNSYQGPFTSEELVTRFPSVMEDGTSNNREGFVNTVRDQRQPLFLASLVQMLTTENDLVVADRLTAAISDLSGQNFRPRDYHRIVSWWATNANNQTNWPFSTFERASRDFASARYREAAIAFEDIMRLDPGADKSRATAVASYLELGDTNRAAALLADFKYPNVRWAQWARAMMDLGTGNISNGTFCLFRHSTNYPGCPGVLLTDHVYRRVDRALFDRLRGTNNSSL